MRTRLNLDIFVFRTVRKARVAREGLFMELRSALYESRSTVVLIDVDQLNRAQEDIREAADFTWLIVDSVREPLLILDRNLTVQMANGTFYSTFRTTAEETEGRHFSQLELGQGGRPELQRLLESVLPENKDFDDVETECEVPHLAAVLRIAGHEVRTVCDGRSGLAAAIEFAPDLALVDIGLPGMNGYEIARAIRDRPELNRMLLIAQTGYG